MFFSDNFCDGSLWVFFKFAVRVHQFLNGHSPLYLSDVESWSVAQTLGNICVLPTITYLQFCISASAFTTISFFSCWSKSLEFSSRFIRHPTTSVGCFRYLLKMWLKGKVFIKGEADIVSRVGGAD